MTPRTRTSHWPRANCRRERRAGRWSVSPPGHAAAEPSPRRHTLANCLFADGNHPAAVRTADLESPNRWHKWRPASGGAQVCPVAGDPQDEFMHHAADGWLRVHWLRRAFASPGRAVRTYDEPASTGVVAGHARAIHGGIVNPGECSRCATSASDRWKTWITSRGPTIVGSSSPVAARARR